MSTIPNFFLVGASKAGTTSIAQALFDHPEVFMTDPKEPNFFNRFDDADTVDQKEKEQYLGLYAKVAGEKVVGEASVSYLDSEKASEHLYKHNPDARILICLRSPMERVTSLYEMYVRLGLEQTFEFATVTDPWLTRQCFYVEKVKRYLDKFSKDQVHWITFDDLQSDWNRCMEPVCQFLELPPNSLGKSVVRNTGGVPRGKLASALTDRKLVEIGKKIIPKPLHNVVDKKLKDKAFQKIVIPKQQVEDLRSAFLPDVLELDELLGTQYADRWRLGVPGGSEGESRATGDRT